MRKNDGSVRNLMKKGTVKYKKKWKEDKRNFSIFTSLRVYVLMAGLKFIFFIRFNGRLKLI